MELSIEKIEILLFIAAYGWKSDLSAEELLEKLLALNFERGK